jgi:hypothetical protein
VVPDSLAFILLSVAWAPVLVLLHEAAHALAAVALTDGEVSISMRGAGLLGGSATYEPASLRHARDEAWIAAAGAAATLLVAAVLWLAWLGSGSDSLATVIGVGAAVASAQFVMSALPLRYGAGLGGPSDSDGRVIWRVLTGAPPGGIERELHRLGKREPVIRPAFAGLLVICGALGLLVEPLLVLALAGLFGAAILLQRSDTRG